MPPWMAALNSQSRFPAAWLFFMRARLAYFLQRLVVEL
ncbi:hypothetical protein O166_22970 [Pseudogulbenkiania ferrooxidans EGD-HP2]|uniref:Uncharacterized protein n=1 Tax=Pseudogulbenkiania ferrooxidans EGD-HP2 TaxID=1388764 RepID=A0ABP2XPT1_9NEIS|nr:hypothetical protein O166_22970 [Pseudogulbenkiania ferrooxidans EGD-HP2]